MKINWLYVGIGAVVLYLLWRKFSNSSGITSSDSVVEIDEENVVPAEVRSDVSQGDMVNELAFASGMTASPSSLFSPPCFCNGDFLGFTNKANCRRMCRKSVKFHSIN